MSVASVAAAARVPERNSITAADILDGIGYYTSR